MKLVGLAVFLSIWTLVIGEVDAGQTKASQIGCLSAEAFDEASQAVAKNDKAWFEQLREARRCMIVKAGLKAQMIGCSWGGVCRYRVWIGSSSLILFMYQSAVHE